MSAFVKWWRSACVPQGRGDPLPSLLPKWLPWLPKSLHKAKRPVSQGWHSCQRLFYGAQCLELHASKAQDGKPSNPTKAPVCASRRKCGHCRKLLVGLQAQGEHKCRWGKCPSCRQDVDLSEHQCFVQVAHKWEMLKGEMKCLKEISVPKGEPFLDKD